MKNNTLNASIVKGVKVIITCPNCDSKFRVPEEAIGMQGRFVRCSICSYEWNAIQDIRGLDDKKEQKNNIQYNLDEDLLKEEHKEELQEQIVQEGLEVFVNKSNENNEDIKCNRKKNNYYKVLLYLVFLIVIVILTGLNLVFYKKLVLDYFPQTKMIYDKLAIYDTDGLKLETFILSQIENSDDKSKFIEAEVKAVIKNTSSSTYKLYSLRMSTYNLWKIDIGYFIMKINKEIKAGESLIIEGRLTGLSRDTKYVIADIGNVIDMYLRNIDFIITTL